MDERIEKGITPSFAGKPFEKLIDQSPFGIYTVDSDFRIAQVSQAALPAFENVRPLIGRDFSEAMHVLWPHELAEEIVAIFRETLRSGDPYVAPSLTETRHDTEKTESYEWQVVRDTLPDGQLGLVCYFYDTTRLRSTQRQLKASEQRYRSLFEFASDGIVIFDLDSLQIVDTNPLMEELLGDSHAHLMEQKVLETGILGGENQARQSIETLKNKGYLRHENITLDCFDDTQKDVEVVCSTYKVDGRGVGQCRVRDISSSVRMNRQIREQSEQLATASKRKDEFLAMLSHELRNPMAAISTALEVIGTHKQPNPDSQDRMRGVINRQMRHLNRLTDELLDMSRVTTGKMQLDCQKVDLRQIVDDAVDRVKPKILQRQQELQVNSVNEPIWLQADASRLEQVLENLLDNASRFTPSEGCIAISCSADDDYVEVKVEDNGVGLTEDMVMSIFDLFTQADTSLHRTEGGLGIGLALVQGIVDLHGGTITASSPGPNQGSVFRVQVPLNKTVQTEPAEPQSDSRTEQHSGLRVLVVDDNKDATRATAMLLDIWGYQTKVAFDGVQALDIANDFVPDIILCDIGLPHKSGYEVATELRENEKFRNVFLVAITGYGKQSDKGKALASGFDVHMVKPVEAQQLQTVLSSYAEK